MIITKKLNTSLFFICFIIFSELAFSQVLNIEKYRTKKDTTEWSAEFGLNISLIKTSKSINSVTNYFNVDYKQGRSTFFLISKINWMEADEMSLSKNGFYHIRYNYKIVKKLTAEAFTQYQYNHQLNIRSRELYGTGFRFKINDLEDFRSYLGSSIMYEEKQLLENKDIIKGYSMSNYISLTYFFHNENKLVSTTYYQPTVKDFKNYRISSESTLVMVLAKGFSFNAGLEFTYESVPLENMPNLTYILSNSIIYRF